MIKERGLKNLRKQVIG